jgi:hypothetical protein
MCISNSSKSPFGLLELEIVITSSSSRVDELAYYHTLKKQNI